MNIIVDLTEKVKSKILENGPMPIASFMEFTLQHCADGYYTSKDFPVGKKGDFITAPEISQLFGEIIGVWCANFWQASGSPKNFNLIELGPGNGTLMKDLLRATKNVKNFHDSMNIHLIEINSSLIEKQKENISHPRIEWHKSYDEVDEKFSIIIANEFFDALPINQYVKKENKWHINMVDLHKDQHHLCINSYNARENIRSFLFKEFNHVPEDGIVEINDTANILVKKISENLNKNKGGILIIDYGYTDNQHRNFISTLQSIKDHKFHPIFENIGSTDISAHVNFASLANTAKIYGAQVHGPITQRQFLLNMQIEARRDILLKNSKNSQQHHDLISGYNRLLDTTQMGSLFKAMAITGSEYKYIGF